MIRLGSTSTRHRRKRTDYRKQVSDLHLTDHLICPMEFRSKEFPARHLKYDQTMSTRQATKIWYVKRFNCNDNLPRFKYESVSELQIQPHIAHGDEI